MNDRVTPHQLELLRALDTSGRATATLRDLSDLRWLEHLQLVTVTPGGRFVATPKGHALASGMAATSHDAHDKP